MSHAESDCFDEALRQAWQDWLAGFGFQAFYTQTFSEPVTYPRLAMNRAWKVLRTLTSRYGVGVRAFVVAEEHLLGTYHAHALVLTFPKHVLRLKDSLKWIWMVGSEYGLCRFESINKIGGVSGYVSKYLTKRVCDYDIFSIDPL